jgi:hypothetical protein
MAAGQQEQTVRVPYLRLVPPTPSPRERRELQPLRAVVFMPPGTPAAARWTDACSDYIQRRGYRLAAVVGAWRDVIQLVFGDEADVVVVGRRDQLPPDRIPRVDVVVEEDRGEAPNRRRPKRLK